MGVAAAQEPSPGASPAALPSPLPEWAAANSSGDADRLLALYTDDALWQEVAIGLAAQGEDEIRAHLDRLYTAVPDITVDVTSGFVAGDHAVVEWKVTGTYSSDFPGLPPAAGQHFSIRGASVFELADGKIRDTDIGTPTCSGAARAPPVQHRAAGHTAAVVPAEPLSGAKSGDAQPEEPAKKPVLNQSPRDSGDDFASHVVRWNLNPSVRHRPTTNSFRVGNSCLPPGCAPARAVIRPTRARRMSPSWLCLALPAR